MANLLNLLKKNKGHTVGKGLGESRRMALLRALQMNREGLAADQLSKKLGVTRSAVHQQLAGLERDGLVERSDFARTTGGRPGVIYRLTGAGDHVFPKRYDWLAGFAIEMAARRLGAEELRAELNRIGADLGTGLAREIGTATKAQRIAKTAEKMTELGYAADPQNPASPSEITAHNCIYHHLAADYPDVCELDLALLEAAVGERPVHAECVVRGGAACRFVFPAGAEETKAR